MTYESTFMKQIMGGLSSIARPGDRYNRFDECAVLDFLRMLGVNVGVQHSYVQLASSIYRSLWKKRA
jgi:hypothetical protein